MESTICEITWILGLFKDLDVNGMEPPTFCDNKAAIHISNNLFTIREQNILAKIGTKEEPADLYTNGLSSNMNIW